MDSGHVTGKSCSMGFKMCRVFTFALMFGWLGMAVAAENSTYRLQAGDIVEISVLSIADLRQSVEVGTDGRISFPLVGNLTAIDLTIEELEEEVRNVLPARLYPMRLPDGRIVNINIMPEEITARVTEYTPVYLRGDVAVPGAQRYRPGLTVRQAVALAGGYDVVRFRMGNPFLESLDLRSEYSSMWLEYAHSQARLARLSAERNGLDEMGITEIIAPISATAIIEIIANEAAQFRERQTNRMNERLFIDEAITDAEREAQSVEEALQREEASASADRAEYDDLRELFRQGTVPAVRVADARRASLASSTQIRQTTTRLREVRLRILELRRQLERTETAQTQEILRERQEEGVRLETLAARLGSVAEKMLYTGAIKSQLVQGRGDTTSVLIFRRSGTSAETITANEDTQLLPGDVVDIALQIAPPM